MEHPHGVARPASTKRSPSNLTFSTVAWAGGGALRVLARLLPLLRTCAGSGVPAGGISTIRPVVVTRCSSPLSPLHHSVFARTGVKAWIRRHLPAALERSIYTWVASLLFIAVCRAWQPVPGMLYQWDSPCRSVAYAIQFSGIVLTFSASRALDVLDLAGIRPVLRARDRRHAGACTAVDDGGVRDGPPPALFRMGRCSSAARRI